MKKLLLLLVLMLVPMLASAEVVEIDGICYSLVPKGKVAKVMEKSSGSYNVEDLVIPETVFYEGVEYNVTAVGNRAFCLCSKLKTVVLPNSVTIIEDDAFNACKALTSITLSDNLTSIGNNVFESCKSLTTLSIPNKVTKIGDYAFESSGIKTIIIPNSVTTLGHHAFAFSAITSITLSNNMTWINSGMFYRTPLESICIPNSVKGISENAFYDCGSLSSITISEGLSYIGENAFKNCKGLTAVFISDLEAWCKISFVSPISYAHYLYLNGEEINDLVIPNSVNSIGNYAFYHCSGLTSVTIPNSVDSIGNNAFTGCSSLTSVTIPNSVTKIGDYAFNGCNNMISLTIGNSVTDIGKSAFEACSSLVSLTIPNSVKNIGHYAFNGGKSIKVVTIGNGIKSIGYSSFANCLELTDVYCFAENVPSAYSSTFDGSYIEYATLHVPAKSIEAYKAKAPWSNFKEIVAIVVPEHTLTYTIDGTTFKTYTIEEGETVTPEAEPSKEGYTFSGWSEIPSTMPDHDVTVTGTFTINKYKLTYKVDGTNYKTYDVEYNSAITPEEAPTKEGYTFSGWSEIPSAMPASDVTITGTFTVNKYKLTYTVDGEEYKASDVEYGTKITPEAPPTKEGYTFSGWIEIPSKMPANDVTVIGTFTINKYTITYMIGGVVFKTVEVEYNSAITPPDAPAKEGYDFAWADVPETMPARDITIYGTYTTGINSLNGEENDRQVFTPDGKRVETPKKGLNIIRMSDGTVKKVVVK